MEPLITLPAAVDEDISNCDELKGLPTVVNEVVVPCRTSGCPLPTKTLRAPLLSAVVETPINDERSDTSLSRWSSKGLGGAPPACGVLTTICWFSFQIDAPIEFSFF